MALVKIESGAEPWAPSAHAELIIALHYFDAPLSGVIEQAGTHFLFSYIEGHVERWSIWVYIALPPETSIAELPPGPWSAHDILARLGDRPATVVLAHEDRGIVSSTDAPSAALIERTAPELLAGLPDQDRRDAEGALRLSA